MKQKITQILFVFITLTLLVVVLSNPIERLPALGQLLSPFEGFIQNENTTEFFRDKNATIAKLDGNSIRVYFDERSTPHVYADNSHDLFFAQGYLTASFRLWQMDFMSYASAGRLAEILGGDFLDYDRLQRRTGMLKAAQASLEFIDQDEVTANALEAYTNGVNAYIEQLDYKNYPLEYKLMGYAPEKWTKLKSVLIIKYMANMLSGYEEDVKMSHLLTALGKKDFQRLYPDAHPSATVETGNIAEHLLHKDRFPYKDYLDYSFLTSSPIVSASKHNPKLGSNNWAVSGKKTKSGNPILCNDPHLGLSLPSIWFEMQLHSPGLNVYGVTIPGTPGVIIGFNESIAWGVTNGATDVKDWYKLKLKGDYSSYEMDGKWLNTVRNIEKIKIRGRDAYYDTIYSTMHGPIVVDSSFHHMPEVQNYALKWTLHEPSNEFLTFIQLNRAQDYQQYRIAIQHYGSPVQNFMFAGKDGDIALHHQGIIYKKWDGQGKFVLDGSISSHLYNNKISEDSLPHQVNPDCDFVYSANNRPVDHSYPFYLNGYYSETRSSRIKDLLEQGEDIDVDFMMNVQLDNTNQIAKQAVPILLNLLKKSDENEPRKLEYLTALASWEGSYNKQDTLAQLFEDWWMAIERNTWDELSGFPFYQKPRAHILLYYLEQQPDFSYFDILETDDIETAGEVVKRSFEEAWNAMPTWKLHYPVWADTNKVNITHLSFLDALSIKGIPMSGHPEAINAVSKDWGPSFRMIVELGERPVAYGIYAGGQSGNPASSEFDQFLDDWAGGRYYRLNFFMNENEAKEQYRNKWELMPEH